MTNHSNLPIIVAISGASGSIYGIRLLEELKKLKQKTILVVSNMGFTTLKQELNLSPKEVIALADDYYENSNLSAPISSGSYLCQGMIVAPCSIKSLSGIANSYNDNLITRSADVILKEKRKLILLVRESPLHLGHLQLMVQATSCGAIICPPMPAFYNSPETINDVVSHSVFRTLDLLNITNNYKKRWH
ncbi:Flavin prenyltransferase UbiX [Candidatus Hepatincola sp. Pdp]